MTLDEIKKARALVESYKRAANQMRLALAGQVSFDHAAHEWDTVADEGGQALTAALDEIERLHRGFRDMQRGTFYAQDEDGCLRRWFPPALKGDDQ